jgi:UDP-N-acetylmuramoyl-L-alanyl-D-glutamate--2,6-diaminopimelate ligase
MIERLCADSRRCAPGVAFVAYPGESADGRRYIDDALARGSGAVFWEAEDSAGTTPGACRISACAT